MFRPILALFLASLVSPSLASAAEAKSPEGRGIRVHNTLPTAVVVQYLASGGKVRNGEIIAVLDCRETAERLAEVQARIESQKAGLREKEELLRNAREESVEKIAAAEQEADEAARVLAKYREGDAPAAEIALQLALHDAETAWKQQSERFNARDKLLAEGFIQKIEYDNEEVLLKRTKLVLDAAKLKLNTFAKYEKEQTAEAHARAAAAKKVLVEKLRVERAALEAASEKALNEAKAELTALEETQASLERLLQKTVVRAEHEGVFTPGDPARNDARPKRGQLIEAGQVLGVLSE